jgi:Cu-Zn family superoxide dismutase
MSMQLLRRWTTVALALLLSTLVLGAAQNEKKDVPPKGSPQKAICVLTPTKGSMVAGKVTFTVTPEGVEIAGTVTGLTPGKHGFHVHEFGDMSSADGLATGGHFNPEKEKHGGPHAAERHVGDLGNITADDSGTATIKISDSQVRLYGKHSVLGRGLIVHAKEDDLKTQPTGDAGGRVAQGVIGVAK